MRLSNCCYQSTTHTRSPRVWSSRKIATARQSPCARSVPSSESHRRRNTPVGVSPASEHAHPRRCYVRRGGAGEVGLNHPYREPASDRSRRAAAHVAARSGRRSALRVATRCRRGSRCPRGAAQPRRVTNPTGGRGSSTARPRQSPSDSACDRGGSGPDSVLRPASAGRELAPVERRSPAFVFQPACLSSPVRRGRGIISVYSFEIQTANVRKSLPESNAVTRFAPCSWTLLHSFRSPK